MGSFALLLILYGMCVSPLSLYISPFLLCFGCFHVPQFQEAYVLGNISPPQEFLYPGTFGGGLRGIESGRFQRKPEAWRSLANIGRPAAKKGRQK